MSLEGKIETEEKWMKLVYGTLEEIKEGELYKIDLIPDFINNGDISRREAMPYIIQGLSKFVRKIESMGIKRYILRPPYMHNLNELYKQAKKALNEFEEGKEPIYFRGNII